MDPAPSKLSIPQIAFAGVLAAIGIFGLAKSLACG